MNVYLTFDVEIWCNGWKDLDLQFPSSFQRYVYGQSRYGDYALPKTLEILDQHNLKGVFFVEPLFAARFGIDYLRRITDLISKGGHDIQLHLHPEWTDEIRPLIFPGAVKKRQHMFHYLLEEQVELIKLGINLLRQAGVSSVNAFRAGSFAVNADSYKALAQCGIRIDSSLNYCHFESGVDLRGTVSFLEPSRIEGIEVLPITVFQDGFKKLRPAQIGACSFMELQSALESAVQSGVEHFVIVSHNFEMLRQRGSEPDRIVAARFEKLCRYLDGNRSHYDVSSLKISNEVFSQAHASCVPKSATLPTLKRHIEQVVRRMYG